MIGDLRLLNENPCFSRWMKGVSGSPAAHLPSGIKGPALHEASFLDWLLEAVGPLVVVPKGVMLSRACVPLWATASTHSMCDSFYASHHDFDAVMLP